MSLRIIPLTLDQANYLVWFWHRHHKPCTGHRFSLGVQDENGKVHGAAIVGRPVSRMTSQYVWADVNRLVTDGHKNACSALYAACARTAKEMGFERIQTFILETEPGTSLKAAGWEFDQWSDGGDWNVRSRRGRRIDQPMCRKQRWKKELNLAFKDSDEFMVGLPTPDKIGIIPVYQPTVERMQRLEKFEKLSYPDVNEGAQTYGH